MYGPSILISTLNLSTRTDRYGNRWQYHSRSDHHSKVACWGIIFDLMMRCSLLRAHVSAGKAAFGINHEMRDFSTGRKKNLDLIICTPAQRPMARVMSLSSMATTYEVVLNAGQKQALDDLPSLIAAPVGAVLLALEAKACMTAHQRALPRLYDELNSSHLTVHGATDQAIAAGFVMINVSERYLSPDNNKMNRLTTPIWSRHVQPRDAGLAVAKVRELPYRSRTGIEGYDALAMVLLDMQNDGSSVALFNQPPAPAVNDIHHYESMIERLNHLYSTRYSHL